MAMSAVTTDDVNCPVCLDTFANPRSLPCGHSFCHTCLNNHINETVKRASFNCPLCRKCIRVGIRNRDQQEMDDLAGQFPINFSLVQMIEAMEKVQAQNDTEIRLELRKLEQLFRMVEKKCNDQCEQQLQQLDVVVTSISEDIDKTAEETIQHFTSAVRSERNKIYQKLVDCHKTAQRIIQEKSWQTKYLINGQRKSLALIDQLASNSTVSEPEINDKKEKIKLAQKTVNYFDVLLDDVSSCTLTFKKFNKGSDISHKFGTVTLTEERTLSSLILKTESNK